MTTVVSGSYPAVNSDSDATINGLTVGKGGGAVSSNTVVGSGALATNSSGTSTAAFGVSALAANTTGSNNTGIGSQALFSNTTASNNTAVGYQAGYSITTSSECVAVGYLALDALTTGVRHVAVGRNALGAATVGNDNVAIGDGSLANCTTGSGNIGVGDIAAVARIFNVTTENDRLVMGHNNITNAYVKVAWTVTSDARDKTNIIDLGKGLAFVQQLQPKQYQFRTSRTDETPTGNIRYGFLAQDILALEGDNPVIIDNEQPDKLKYNGESLVPVLVNAIKELNAKVTTLEAQLGAK
jgi:hypothetical protein